MSKKIWMNGRTLYVSKLVHIWNRVTDAACLNLFDALFIKHCSSWPLTQIGNWHNIIQLKSLNLNVFFAAAVSRFSYYTKYITLGQQNLSAEQILHKTFMTDLPRLIIWGEFPSSGESSPWISLYLSWYVCVLHFPIYLLFISFLDKNYKSTLTSSGWENDSHSLCERKEDFAGKEKHKRTAHATKMRDKVKERRFISEM